MRLGHFAEGEKKRKRKKKKSLSVKHDVREREGEKEKERQYKEKGNANDEEEVVEEVCESVGDWSGGALVAAGSIWRRRRSGEDGDECDVGGWNRASGSGGFFVEGFEEGVGAEGYEDESEWDVV